MLSKILRFSAILLACLPALSLSTVATAAEPDEDEEETESRASRKKARKAPAAEADEDEDDTSSRKSRKRRSDPEEDEEEEEDTKPKKPVEAPSYAQRTGFVLQTSLVTQTTALNAGTSTLQLSSLEGGLTFGYKTRRLILGLGFDFTTVNDATPQVATSTYSFVVYPEVQYAFIQSDDQRVELIGNASAGLGSFGASRSNMNSNDTTELRVRWRVGPGVRYWIHPQLGAALVTGVTGNHLLVFSPSGAASASTVTTSLYTQIGLVGVF